MRGRSQTEDTMGASKTSQVADEVEAKLVSFDDSLKRGCKRLVCQLGSGNHRGGLQRGDG